MMGIIGLLFFGFIALVVIGYLFYLLRTVIIVATFLTAVYLIFFTDYLALGVLVGIGWIVLAGAFEKCEEDTENKNVIHKKSKEEDWDLFSSRSSDSPHGKRKARPKKGINLNYLLIWMIPLFWPFLIFQTFFRDKQAGKLDEYDYEQHLKSNGK